MTADRYPYVGLRPFTKQEASLLCGRDDQIGLLKQKLIDCFATDIHLLAVLGVSGCGKSSVVRAGLLPQLETDSVHAWHIADCRPGSAPYYELAKGLLENSQSGFYTAYQESLYVQTDSPDMLIELLEGDLRQGSYSFQDLLEQLHSPPLQNQTEDKDPSSSETETKRLPPRYLLLIDQFEELFRYTDDSLQGDAIEFVRLLLTAATHPDVAVILTMRPEYLEHCTQMEGLAEAIGDAVYLLPRMSEEEREQAIRKPLKKQNYDCRMEEDLVRQLLNAMEELPTLDEKPYYIPDRLPLLQHALYRSWLKAEDRTEELKAGGIFRVKALKNAEKIPPLPPSIEIQLQDYQAITQLSAVQIAPRLLPAQQADLQVYLGEIDKQHDLTNNPLQAALVHTLEKLFYTLTPENQQKLAKIFAALVEYDNVNKRLVRRVVRFADVCALFSDDDEDYANLHAELSQLLHIYRHPANHILTPPTHRVTMTDKIKELALEPDTMLDVSHETLIMYWPRLRQWAGQDAEDGALLHDLYRDALRWKTEGKQTFWTGGKLAAASQRVAELQPKRVWLSRYVADDENVLTDIQAFLRASQAIQNRQYCIKRSLQAAAALLLIVILGVVWKGMLDRRYQFDLHLSEAITLESVGRFSDAQDKLSLASEKENFLIQAHDIYSNHLLQTKITLSSLTTRESKSTLVLDKQKYPKIEPLSALVISPAGQYALAGSEKQDEEQPHLYLVDLRHTEQHRSINSGHFHNINALLFHPTGNYFFSAGNDGQLIQWQFNGFVQPQPLKSWWVGGLEDKQDLYNENTANDIHALALTADNTRILYATAGGRIYVRELATGVEQVLYENSSAINALVVTDKQVYTAFRDNRVVVFDWAAKGMLTEKQTLTGHTHSVERLALSKNTKLLASGGADGKIILWDTQTLTPTRELKKYGDSMVNGLVFIDKDTRLVSSGDDFALRLWDVDSGRTLRVFEGHSGRVRALAAVAGSEQVCSVSNDRTLHCWKMTLSNHQKMEDDPSFAKLNNTATAISADGRYVVLGSATGKLQVYDRKAGDLSAPVKGHDGRISESALVFSPDNQSLFSAGYDKKLKRWSWQAGQLGQAENIQADQIAEFGVISKLTFSPDGKWLILGNEEGGLAVLTTQDYSQYSADTVNAQIVALSFDRTGQRLLVADCSQLHYYAFSNGKLNKIGASRALDKNSLWSAALSPDGRYAVAVGNTQTVSLFTVSKHGLSEQAQTLPGHTEAILQAKFAPSGHLITAGADATVRFWEVERARQLFSLELPSAPRPQLLESNGDDLPLRSFDFHCALGTENCILAVPLNKRGALALYEF